LKETKDFSSKTACRKFTLLKWKNVLFLFLIHFTVAVFRLDLDFFAHLKGRGVVKKRQMKPTENPITRLHKHTRLHEIYNYESVTERQYLWCSSGPGGIQNIERMVRGQRNAIMRPSSGHLFIPVQTQLWTQ